MMLRIKVIELSQRLEKTRLNASYGLNSAGRNQKYVHLSISVHSSTVEIFLDTNLPDLLGIIPWAYTTSQWIRSLKKIRA